MPLNVQCSCGFRWAVEETLAGSSMKCPRCGATVPVRQAISPPRPPSPFKAPSVLDPALGDWELNRLRTELVRGEWQRTHKALEACRDWDRRSFMVEVLAEQKGRPIWLHEWVKAEPQSSIGYLIRGAQGIRWAWQARGSGRAATVDKETWELFFQRIGEATKDLTQALRIDPVDPTPLSWLLTAGLGISAPKEEMDWCLETLLKLDLENYAGRHSYLTSQSKRWGGSHEKMFEFARATSAAMPAGSPSHAIVCDAHVERWLYAWAFDKDHSSKLGYFRAPEVQEEIVRAWENSAGSPQFKRSAHEPHALNSFAFCFHMARDTSRARAAFEALGARICKMPWAFLEDPLSAFLNARVAYCK